MPQDKNKKEREMEEIRLMLTEQKRVNEHQEKMLEQILWLLKGSESLGIEGVIPAQKRIEIILNEIVTWRQEIIFYFNLLSSKKIWKIAMYVTFAVIIGWLTFKYGIWIVYDWLKKAKELL